MGPGALRAAGFAGFQTARPASRASETRSAGDSAPRSGAGAGKAPREPGICTGGSLGMQAGPAPALSDPASPAGERGARRQAPAGRTPKGLRRPRLTRGRAQAAPRTFVLRATPPRGHERNVSPTGPLVLQRAGPRCTSPGVFERPPGRRAAGAAPAGAPRSRTPAAGSAARRAHAFRKRRPPQPSARSV